MRLRRREIAPDRQLVEQIPSEVWYRLPMEFQLELFQLDRRLQGRIGDDELLERLQMIDRLRYLREVLTA